MLPTPAESIHSSLATPAWPLTQRYEAQTPDEVHTYLGALYGPHAMRTQAKVLDTRVCSGSVARLQLGDLRYGASVEIRMPQAHGHWVFSLLRAGHARRQGLAEGFGVGDAGVMRPDDVLTLSLSEDVELLNLCVRDEDLHRAFGALMGPQATSPMHLVPRAPQGSLPATALTRVWGHLRSMPAYAGPGRSVLEERLQEATLFELLLAWPGSACQRDDEAGALPRCVAAARDFIHAQAALAPRVSEIAAAAGVSVRALARGFERHLGVSPWTYQLNHRLDRVHERLTRAAARPTTVTAVATDWGFTHLGAFAAQYRRRFGQSPSRTLARHGVPIPDSGGADKR